MAVSNYTGLVILNPQVGIQITKVTDSSADWTSVANSTYFYDKTNKLVYFKNSSGVIVDLFSVNIYNSDGILTTARTVDLFGNQLTFTDNGTGRFTVNSDDGTNAVIIDAFNGGGVSLSASSPGGAGAVNITTSGVNISGYYNLPNVVPAIGDVLTCTSLGNTTWTQPFIPPVEASEIRRGAIAINNTTTIGTFGGLTSVITGSSVALLMGTSTATKLPKLRILTSTGSTNSTVGLIFGSQSSIQTLEFGFRFVGSYVFSDVSSGGTEWFVPNARQFCGLVGSTTLVAISSTVTVASLTNIIGFGSDVGDTNLQIFHNDASGVATKIDLGATFPANKTGAVANGIGYQLELYAPFGATTVKYRVTRLTDQTEVTGTITTNLPASTTLLCPQVCRTSGSTSQNVSIDFIQLNAYTLN
jgi:hypothetical protein